MVRWLGLWFIDDDEDEAMEREFQDALSRWLTTEMRERWGHSIRKGAHAYRLGQTKQFFSEVLPAPLCQRLIALIQTAPEWPPAFWHDVWPLLDDEDVAVIMKAGAAAYIGGEEIPMATPAPLASLLLEANEFEGPDQRLGG